MHFFSKLRGPALNLGASGSRAPANVHPWFTHTNIIKAKKFYITFAFCKCEKKQGVAFLKSLSISLHNPRIIKDAFCLHELSLERVVLHPLFLALKGSPLSYQHQLYHHLLCTLLGRAYFILIFNRICLLNVQGTMKKLPKWLKPN